jgi:hypothetical protein
MSVAGKYFCSIWSFLDNLAFTQGYVDVGDVKTRYINAAQKMRLLILPFQILQDPQQ